MITEAKYTDESKEQIVFVQDGIIRFCPTEEENSDYKKMLREEITIEEPDSK